VFYLQARQGNQLVSLKLEKEQVLFLAGGLTEVLADLGSPSSVPVGADLELEQPVEPEWVVGSIQLAYDADADRVVLMAREVVAEGEGEAAPDESGQAGFGEAPSVGDSSGPSTAAAGAVARVLLTREQAAGMIEHGKRLLRGGRPPCPLCGYPLGEGHSCPRTNGHRSPSL
jgi:uncharacterized repeat protein (TIGR03847 family)